MATKKPRLFTKHILWEAVCPLGMGIFSPRKIPKYSPNLGNFGVYFGAFFGVFFGAFFGAFFGVYFWCIFAFPIGRKAKYPKIYVQEMPLKIPQKIPLKISQKIPLKIPLDYISKSSKYPKHILKGQKKYPVIKHFG